MAVETDIERIKSILGARHTPDWFDDAKLGVFINWGLFSIPAWAPKSEPLAKLLRSNYKESNKLTPYAHWYWNGMRIEGSPTWRYHQDVWKGCPYDAFREPFSEAVRKWDPDVWAERLHSTGARYVVLSAKSHDGYLLWPSAFPNPKREGWQTERDVVGELADAVRKRGMQFGIYYSAGLDWTFDEEPILGGLDVYAHVPDDPAYGNYVVSHYRELIERYEPNVLWNDIGFPDIGSFYQLLYFYVTHVPEGALNDRFVPVAPAFHFLRRSWVRSVANIVARWRMNGSDGPVVLPESPLADFRTAEYLPFPKAQSKKWEMVSGLGNSSAWNRAETDADLLSADELLRLFVDSVSRNGNLLVGLGPTDTGALPEPHMTRLEALGRWLEVNSDAIYGTHVWWARSQGKTADGMDMRFTGRPGVLYTIFLGTPRGDSVTIEEMPRLEATQVELLGYGPVEASVDGDGNLTVAWPAGIEERPAYCLKVVLDESPE